MWGVFFFKGFGYGFLLRLLIYTIDEGKLERKTKSFWYFDRTRVQLLKKKKPHRSSGLQVFKSSGLQVFRSSGPQTLKFSKQWIHPEKSLSVLETWIDYFADL
jgi:hypothetical protein